jgi:hypothetical protein
MGTGNKTRKTAVAGVPVAATEKIISKALLSRSEEKRKSTLLPYVYSLSCAQTKSLRG